MDLFESSQNKESAATNYSQGRVLLTLTGKDGHKFELKDNRRIFLPKPAFNDHKDILTYFDKLIPLWPQDRVPKNDRPLADFDESTGWCANWAIPLRKHFADAIDWKLSSIVKHEIKKS